MVGVKAARNSAELFAPYRAEHLPECPISQDALKVCRIGCDMVSNDIQIFGRRHIDASSHEKFDRPDVEIEARSPVLLKSLSGE